MEVHKFVACEAEGATAVPYPCSTLENMAEKEEHEGGRGRGQRRKRKGGPRSACARTRVDIHIICGSVCDRDQES